MYLVKFQVSFCRYRHHEKTKEPNNKVLLGALLLGCIVPFVVSNLCLGTFRRNQIQRSEKYVKFFDDNLAAQNVSAGLLFGVGDAKSLDSCPCFFAAL